MAGLFGKELDSFSTREEAKKWLDNAFLPDFISLISFLDPSWLPEVMEPSKIPPEIAGEAIKLAEALEKAGFGKMAGEIVLRLASVCVPFKN